MSKKKKKNIEKTEKNINLFFKKTPTKNHLVLKKKYLFFEINKFQKFKKITYFFFFLKKNKYSIVIFLQSSNKLK